MRTPQKRRGVAAFVAVLTALNFSAASGLLPPWWIIHRVRPAGPLIDMGTWKRTSFSADQQARFHINEIGDVLDEEKFKTAIDAWDAGKRRLTAPAEQNEGIETMSGMVLV
eukprot:TRINITY_DN70705_c0_g1_i1.p1 TRINITY_DN70705_c0_g1~~TRINITY_DN70705_c0_g1_i1.p1  ORF type:complete len:111 (+),score=21.88 TRINITY_DN70705_c0_g1_i1:87-419(+)